MKPIDIDPIIKAIEARQDNAEDLPPLTTGDFLRMLREASESKTQTNLCEANWGDEVNKALRWVKDEFINSENTVIEAEGSADT